MNKDLTRFIYNIIVFIVLIVLMNIVSKNKESSLENGKMLRENAEMLRERTARFDRMENLIHVLRNEVKELKRKDGE